ncbi:QcrA and Rieske domain-containing protein [Alkalihalobacillus sp. CinArs1]|uniref:QcrA and Rieske domain-containing protein n=1 Tax=Alkalihalobacillus sp. CinArs1 TaxID=2995314 RepID=UPI0022DE4EC1|nr:ubiquinol-cytochrome c reductase iron-sulfur subunit [Alkalihalobacillus sp. CinArs1]
MFAEQKMTRRKFLKYSSNTILASIVALCGLSIITTACAAPKGITEGAMIKLGSLKELRKGPLPKKVEYSATLQDGWTERETKGFVYISKNVDDELIIMSPVCTHLGCTVPFADEAQRMNNIEFFCPCHGGQYDEAGMNIGGPPPRPLDIFNPIVKGDEVYINILNVTERT